MAQRVTPYKSGINYWLLVADPDDYSYSDLERNASAVWNRVKDYASLKHLRDVDSDEEVFETINGIIIETQENQE